MSVGIFKNGKYNKVAGNAKDSTAANTTYNNGTSGLQANNVQSAIDELNSNLNSKIGYVDITIPSIPITVADNGVYYTNANNRVSLTDKLPENAMPMFCNVKGWELSNGSIFYPFIDSANRINCMSATAQTVKDLIIRVWYVYNL